MFKWGVNGVQVTVRSSNVIRPSVLFYSTSVASSDRIPNPLTVEYLIKSVGLSEEEAVVVATNPKVSHRLDSTENSKLVVDTLKNNGFDKEQIRNLVVKIPSLLRFNVDKTLKPKLRVFEELGFRGPDLGLVISHNAYVLNRSLDGHIVPAIRTLKSFFASDEQFVRFMLKTKSTRFLSSHVLRYLPDNCILLQTYGLPKEKIKLLLRQKPNFLLQRTQWIESIVNKVEERLGIPRTSPMFLHGISALTRKSEEKMKSWLDILRSYGWSEDDIANLLRRHPLCLCISEESLRLRMKYLMEDLGLRSDYLTTVPALLSYSMKKRILPRVAVMNTLKCKDLLKRDLSLPSFLYMAEHRFLEKFVLPFKETLPELVECYTQATLSKT